MVSGGGGGGGGADDEGLRVALLYPCQYSSGLDVGIRLTAYTVEQRATGVAALPVAGASAAVAWQGETSSHSAAIVERGRSRSWQCRACSGSLVLHCPVVRLGDASLLGARTGGTGGCRGS